jgi:hypothetical protein
VLDGFNAGTCSVLEPSSAFVLMIGLVFLRWLIDRNFAVKFTTGGLQMIKQLKQNAKTITRPIGETIYAIGTNVVATALLP